MNHLYEDRYKHVHHQQHYKIGANTTWVHIWNQTKSIPKHIKNEIRYDYSQRYGQYFASGRWSDLFALLNDLIIYYPDHKQNVVELIINVFMTEDAF
eukprot:UN09790